MKLVLASWVVTVYIISRLAMWNELESSSTSAFWNKQYLHM